MVTIAKLPAQTEAEILELIESGGYDDATEIVVQAVHQFARREQALADLRAKIQVGIDQADRGELVDFTPELMDQIRAEARILAQSGAPLDPDVCGE